MRAAEIFKTAVAFKQISVGMIENKMTEGEAAGNAYLVLSVHDLRRLLKQATAGARANGRVGRKVGNHCVVLRSTLLKFGSDPDLQFSSADIELMGGAQ